MAQRPDPVRDLAEKLFATLGEQKRGGTYPLTLQQLATAADPTAPPELILKAAAKKEFTGRVLLLRKKDLTAPVVLAEDAESLAASSLLLESVLQAVCSPAKPLVPLSQLKAKVPAALKATFEEALHRRVREQSWPAGVALVPVKKKLHLHLVRYPLPRDPLDVLTEFLIQALREQRAKGADHYPLPLSRLVQLARPGGDAKLLKKCLAAPAFQAAVVVAVKNHADAPAALAEDLPRLAASPLLLATLLPPPRPGPSEALGLADLAKKVVPPLRPAFEQAVRRQAEERTLPPGLGCVLLKGKPLLFRLEAPARPAAEPPPAAEPQFDFQRRFDEAFQRLDREAGAANFVSLVALRRALPVERGRFDAELHQLRRAGLYSLSAAEGRYGLSPDEQDAGINEDGTLLLYVSRKSP